MASPIPGMRPDVAKATWKRYAADRERRRQSQEMAAKATGSYREFVKLAWAVVEPEHPLIPAWHIDAIADHLQAMVDGHIRNLLICVPPGSAKSTLGPVMLPAWQWLPGRRPGWRSTWASYDSQLSGRDSVKCRDLMRSNWYQETFQPTWKFSADQDEKTYFVNTAKGFRVATSVSGRGTGWRGNLIGADDALNAKERHSEAALREVIDWWDNVVFNRLDDMATDNKLIIMQRIVTRDLAGHVLRRGGYECLIIPMEYDPKRSRVTNLGNGREWRDPRKEAGEIMCPEKFPPHVIAELKQNPATWEAQYQQNPNAEGGSILKPHKWNYWQPAGMQLPPVRVLMPDGTIDERKAVDLPHSFDLTLQSWDFAFKDTKDSDFVVGQVHSVSGARRFIRHQIRGRMDLPASVKAVREMTGQFPDGHLKLVEDKANGPAVIQALRDDIPGLQEVPPEGGKTARAAAGAVELDAGNWFLPHPMLASWVGDPENPEEGGGFLGETSTFPPVPGAGHDDMVDSWSQGAIRIKKERIGGVFGISERSIMVEPFDLKLTEKWPKMFALSSTWNEFAAVWITRQPQTGQHYLYFEYSVPPGDPARHATEIVKQGDWIHGVMLAEEQGRDQKDGFAMAAKYSKMGFKIDTIRHVQDTMILEAKEALSSGKLKVFSNLGRFFDQYRMFRRDDKGRLPEYNTGVVTAMMIAWRARDKMRALPEPPKAQDRTYRGDAPQNRWMGA